MAYEYKDPIGWTNDVTPLNARNLDKMEQGIIDCFNAVNETKKDTEDNIGNLANKIGIKLKSDDYQFNNNTITSLLNELNSTAQISVLDSNNTENPDSTVEVYTNIIKYLRENDINITDDQNLLQLILTLYKELITYISKHEITINMLRYVLGEREIKFPDILDETSINNIPKTIKNPIIGTTSWAENAETYTDVINILMQKLLGNGNTELGFIQTKINDTFTDFTKSYAGTDISKETNIDTYGKILAYIARHRQEFNTLINDYVNKEQLQSLIKEIEQLVNEMTGYTDDEGDYHIGFVDQRIQAEHSKIGIGSLDPTDVKNTESLKNYNIYFRYELE